MMPQIYRYIVETRHDCDCLIHHVHANSALHLVRIVIIEFGKLGPLAFLVLLIVLFRALLALHPLLSFRLALLAQFKGESDELYRVFCWASEKIRSSLSLADLSSAISSPGFSATFVFAAIYS